MKYKEHFSKESVIFELVFQHIEGRWKTTDSFFELRQLSEAI